VQDQVAGVSKTVIPVNVQNGVNGDFLRGPARVEAGAVRARGQTLSGRDAHVNLFPDLPPF
jgi:hypothetical protein